MFYLNFLNFAITDSVPGSDGIGVREPVAYDNHNLDHFGCNSGRDGIHVVWEARGNGQQPIRCRVGRLPRGAGDSYTLVWRADSGATQEGLQVSVVREPYLGGRDRGGADGHARHCRQERGKLDSRAEQRERRDAIPGSVWIKGIECQGLVQGGFSSGRV